MCLLVLTGDRHTATLLSQEAGPTSDEVATVHTLLQRAFETQQAENSYWHEQLMGGYQSRSYQTVRVLATHLHTALSSCTRRCPPNPAIL